MPRLIPVLDLHRGLAVHARGGDRARYRPLRSALVPGAGDAVAVARGYRDALRLTELYVADLDAILGGRPQRALLRALAALGPALWVDAGVRTVSEARRVLADGATRAVVGLETLASVDDLHPLVDDAGADRLAFSLDLRDGRPVAHGDDPVALAGLAARAGVRTMIVLDLARVGTGRGVDTRLVERLHRAQPTLELIVGGGMRGAGDLAALAVAGAAGALVGTMLHMGPARDARTGTS